MKEMTFQYIMADAVEKAAGDKDILDVLGAIRTKYNTLTDKQKTLITVLRPSIEDCIALNAKDEKTRHFADGFLHRVNEIARTKAERIIQEHFSDTSWSVDQAMSYIPQWERENRH